MTASALLGEHLASILDALPDAVTVQDPSRALVYANARAAQIAGYASAEAMLSAGGPAAMEGWSTAHEDGRPLDPEELPGRRALLGEAPEPVVLRAVHRETGRLQWSRVHAVPIRDATGAVALAVNLIEDVTASKLTELRSRVLAQAGELLSGTPEVERTLQQVARLPVPEIAEWCALDLPDGRGGVRQVAIAHTDPSKVAMAREVRARYPPQLEPDQGLGKALAGGSEHYRDIPDELLVQAAQDEQHLELLRGVGMRSVIIVPVRAGAEVFGALTLVDGARSLSDDDLALAEDLGRRAGQAIATARLFEQRTEIARTLQTALLPPQLPSIDGWELASMFTPAAGTDIGGDFYDLFFARDSWWLVIGDVYGRGAPAAALTSMVRYSLRSAAQLSDDPVLATEHVNRTLREHGDLSLCTLAVFRVAHSGGAELLLAGHPPAALVRATGVEWCGQTGPMLGAYDDGRWQTVAADVAGGEAIVLYTDGILDTRGAAGRFGQDRLARALSGAASGDAGNLLRAVERELASFGDGSAGDDAAAVCARRR